MKLSILIPCFNEEKTIVHVIDQVKRLTLPIEKEIIVIDDGSTDGSPSLLAQISGIKLLSKKNGGKGSAMRLGLQAATGDIVIFQDADLEYPAQNIARVLMPLLDGTANVVYGSRFLNELTYKQFWLHWVGNKFLAKFTSLLFGVKLTDLEGCNKSFFKKTLLQLNLKSNGFEFDPEITAKLLKRKIPIYEVHLEFHPRTFEEGKKITLWDGIIATGVLLKYRFLD